MTGFRFDWGIRLALALCGAAIASAAAPLAASAACPSLRHVKAFDGYVSETAGASATGSDPPSSDNETIQLGHVLQKVHVRLADKRHIGFYYDFKGPAFGGTVQVDDVFQEPALDYAGEITYGGPLSRHSPEAGGYLFVDRQTCSYFVSIDVLVLGTYGGDPQVDDGAGAAIGAFSKEKHIPGDLKLHGSDQIAGASPDCSAVDVAKGCASVGSGWIPDLITLYECHTTQPSSGCPNNDNPTFDTPATFAWHLNPVFEKKKK